MEGVLGAVEAPIESSPLDVIERPPNSSGPALPSLQTSAENVPTGCSSVCHDQRLCVEDRALELTGGLSSRESLTSEKIDQPESSAPMEAEEILADGSNTILHGTLLVGLTDSSVDRSLPRVEDELGPKLKQVDGAESQVQGTCKATTPLIVQTLPQTGSGDSQSQQNTPSSNAGDLTAIPVPDQPRIDTRQAVAPQVEIGPRAASQSPVEKESKEPDGSPANQKNKPKKDTTEFNCNVCFDSPINAVVTRCGHLYCWTCLNTWLKAGHMECPTCRLKIRQYDLIPIYGAGQTGGGIQELQRQDTQNSTAWFYVPGEPYNGATLWYSPAISGFLIAFGLLMCLYLILYA